MLVELGLCVQKHDDRGRECAERDDEQLRDDETPQFRIVVVEDRRLGHRLSDDHEHDGEGEQSCEADGALFGAFVAIC